MGGVHNNITNGQLLLPNIARPIAFVKPPCDFKTLVPCPFRAHAEATQAEEQMKGTPMDGSIKRSPDCCNWNAGEDMYVSQGHV